MISYTIKQHEYELESCGKVENLGLHEVKKGEESFWWSWRTFEPSIVSIWFGSGCKIIGAVTGASFPAPRQRNSPYGQMVRRYIYETRQSKKTHFPIWWSTNDSNREPLHGPLTWSPAPSRSYGIRLCLRLWYRNPCQYRKRCKHAATSKACPLPASVIWRKRCHWNQKFCAGHYFWLDSNHRFWIDLTHHFWLDSTHRFQLYPTRDFWLDFTHFFNSIWLTFNVFIFDSSHIIWFPFQSSSRESHIDKDVIEITQHQNCGIFPYNRFFPTGKDISVGESPAKI